MEGQKFKMSHFINITDQTELADILIVGEMAWLDSGDIWYKSPNDGLLLVNPRKLSDLEDDIGVVTGDDIITGVNGTTKTYSFSSTAILDGGTW